MNDIELDNIIDALNDNPLSDEEKIKLLDDARAAFENLPGIEFSELTENEDDNLLNDFKTTRGVLTKNIDRLEKITGLIFDTIAINPENIKAIAIGMECVNAQNNNLRLLAELKNKLLLNKQLHKKSTTAPSGGGNVLPKGFTLK